jgi:tRNA pseudouridine55 synthase
MINWAAPCLTIDVTCEPGTYIRSLAHDLGQTLGCGGALAGLRRTRSGRFQVEDGLSPERMAEVFRAGELAQHLHPISTALSALTPVPVTDEQIKRLRNGQPIDGHTGNSRGGYALGDDGAVVAILRYDVKGEWWPEKVFAAGE